jgi:hypothetical protein
MNKSVLLVIPCVLLLLAGCASSSTTTAGGSDRGHPSGTIPYDIVIEASDEGSRIEVDSEYVGKAPLTVTIYGDKDGTFHGSGDGYTTFRAFPVKPGQYIQTKRFLNGAQSFMFGQQDRIPKRLYFDLNQKTEELEIIGPK